MGGESQEPESLAVNGTARFSRFGVGGLPPILIDIGPRGCFGRSVERRETCGSSGSRLNLG